jgi:hypothetical protein
MVIWDLPFEVKIYITYKIREKKMKMKEYKYLFKAKESGERDYLCVIEWEVRQGMLLKFLLVQRYCENIPSFLPFL